MHTKNLLLHKKGCKYIYYALLTEGPIPNSQLKWRDTLNTQNIHWKTVYTIPKRSTFEVRLWNLQHKIYLYYFNKLCIKKDGTLSYKYVHFCNKELETIEHLFTSCSVTKSLWQSFLVWWNSVTNDNLLLSSLDIILCVCKSNSYLLNHIIWITKQFIYSSRCFKKRNLPINALINEIKASFIVEF